VQKIAVSPQRFFDLSILPGLFGLIGVIAILAGSLVNEFQHASTDARETTESISQVLQEHALATVQKADLLALETIRNVRPGDLRLDQPLNATRKQQLHLLMKSQIASLPEFAVLHVTNAQGNHLYSSLDSVPKVNIADRYHFTRQRDDAQAGLVISPPIVSRTTGKWTLILTRRINFEDGSFAGIVNVILNLDYFQHIYHTLNLGPHGLIALSDQELHLAARYPADEKSMGKVIRSTAKTYIEKKMKVAVYHSKSSLDGIERLISFRQVGELPLFVFAGIAHDDYLAEWRLHAWQYGIGTVIFSIVVIVFWLRQWRAKKQLIAASIYARNLIEASLDPLMTISADGKIMDVNSATEAATGQTRSKLIGSDFASHFTQPELAQAVYRRVWQESEIHDYPLTLLGSDGRMIEVLYNATLYRNEQGEVQGVLASARDITQRKQAEQQLQQAKEAAEAASRAKSEFLSSMSHELRTPMNAIMGFTQLMECDAALPIEHQENVREILKGGRHLMELINQVLNLAKIESGHTDMPLEPLDLGKIIEECLLLVRPLADQRSIQLNHAKTNKLEVQANALWLKQALLNLLSNAIKYNREGGSVSIQLNTQVAGRISILIQDTGPGIAAERMAELFEPFNRLGAECSNIHGTGIGLTITRRIVEMMGGTVLAESTLGLGSTFRIELPRT